MPFLIFPRVSAQEKLCRVLFHQFTKNSDALFGTASEVHVVTKMVSGLEQRGGEALETHALDST